ncbi:MAG: hypothetical protein M3O22_00230 [Pseudomonadota bacterium]|nr:hypothetical protein [Pseudomonadota bacterium]
MSNYMDSLKAAFFAAPPNQARQAVRARNKRIVHDMLRGEVQCMERRRFLKALLRPLFILVGRRP